MLTQYCRHAALGEIGAAILARAFADDGDATLVSDTQCQAQACRAAAYDQYIVLVSCWHVLISLVFAIAMSAIIWGKFTA